MKQYPAPNAPQGPSQPQSPTHPLLPRRRRLLQAGLSVAPALLVLNATPVRADNCKSPSGFSASGNLSRNAGAGCTATGMHAPSYWANTSNLVNGHYQGSGQITPDTLFSDRLPLRGTMDASFGAILGAGNNDIRAVVVAVFLESNLHNNDGFPTRDIIKDMWRGYTVNSYAVPNTGVVWDAPKVQKYLLYLTGQTVPG